MILRHHNATHSISWGGEAPPHVTQTGTMLNAMLCLIHTPSLPLPLVLTLTKSRPSLTKNNYTSQKTSHFSRKNVKTL